VGSLSIGERVIPLTRMGVSLPLSRFALPEWQRGFVWTPGQTLKLWDTICRGWPLPPIWLWEPESNGDVFILDGQQRLSSMLGWRLDGGGTAPKVYIRGNTLTLDTPDPEIHVSYLERTSVQDIARDRDNSYRLSEWVRSTFKVESLSTLRVFILEESEQEAAEIFCRFNGGGTPVNAATLRKARKVLEQ
jgi:Protein of unknown function DUF262